MVRDKKFAAAAIIGFIAAVLLFCVAMTLVSDAEVASSLQHRISQKPLLHGEIT